MSLFRATRPNELISIDHAELPETPDGNKYITSIIDNFSGLVYAEAVPRISAYNTAKVIHNKWFVTRGVPDKILSDQGSDFTSEIVKHLCRLAPCKKLQTTSHHPNTNGQVERWNSTMKKGLRVIGTDKDLDFSAGEGWDLYIDLIVAHYNNSPSRRTGLSPNEIYYGRNVKLPMDYELGLEELDGSDESKNLYKQFINNCKRIKQRLAREQLNEYDKKRKEFADRDRKEVRYDIGQTVIYLSKMKVVGSLGGLKTLWKGPYRIIDSWNDGLNYTIKDMETGKIKNVSVTKLRPYYLRDEDMGSDTSEDEPMDSIDSMEEAEINIDPIPEPSDITENENGNIEYTSSDDMIRLGNRPIILDRDGAHITNHEPEEVINTDVVDTNANPVIYPDYGSPPKRVESEPALEINDGLLLPRLEEKMDNQQIDDENHKPDGIINNIQPISDANKVIGTKRKLEDITNDIIPPSPKRRKFILKMQKYLNKLNKLFL